MTKRRANGEGSFYRRKSDKRWVAVWNGQTKTDKNEEVARQLWKEMKEKSL